MNQSCSVHSSSSIFTSASKHAIGAPLHVVIQAGSDALVRAGCVLRIDQTTPATSPASSSPLHTGPSKKYHSSRLSALMTAVCTFADTCPPPPSLCSLTLHPVIFCSPFRSLQISSIGSMESMGTAGAAQAQKNRAVNIPQALLA